MEEAEEWLLQSLKLYENLHSFELQAPTRVIEWGPQSRVCVAGFRPSGGNELLQLLPPQHLQDSGTQGPRAERDFRVSAGGFSSRPVWHLRHVPDTSLLVTSGPPDDSLQLWRLPGEDSDVLKPSGSIPGEAKSGDLEAKIATSSGRVLHGSRLNSLRLTELETGTRVSEAGFSSSSAISSMTFLDASTALLGSSSSGQLLLLDLRRPPRPSDPESIPLSNSSSAARWSVGVGDGTDGTSRPVACVSSEGDVSLVDLRKVSEPVAEVKVRVPSASSGADFLCVSWAPAPEKLLGISGFDGVVRVLDPRSWAGREAEPLFVHRGHLFGRGEGGGGGEEPPVVTVHAWHPRRPRTLLSAATDASLDLWEWVWPQ